MDPAFALQTLLSGASAGGIYALVAIGFGVMYRTTRVFNIAQGDFGALGAYVAFTVWVMWGQPYWLGLIAACVVVGLLAVVVERVALRPLYQLGETFTFISTIGLGFVIKGGIQEIWGPIPFSVPAFFGDRAVDILGLRVVPQVVWTLLLSLLLSAAMYALFKWSKVGTAMRAAAQDRRVSGLLGIDVDRMYALAFFLGGALGALAGVLIAPIGFMSPTLGTALGVPGFIAALVGGLGNMPGAVVGGLLLGILQAYAVFVIDPRYRDIVVYAVFVAMIILRPRGLFGEEPQAREV
jgi:branched-chain amino acid transport system permease protein